MKASFVKFLCVFMLLATVAGAQTKGKPATGKGNPKAVKGKKAAADSVKVEEEDEVDPYEQFELTLPIEEEIDPLTGKTKFYKDRKLKNDSARKAFREKMRKENLAFKVYTKKPKKNSKEKMQLCINISAKDTNLLYCRKDSVCRDPEVYKQLYYRIVGDTVYALIFVDAFSKSAYEGGKCNGGKETKLFFVRWNAPKGKAIWKTRTVASCIKTITNMTKTPIGSWDGTSVLNVSYHKGSKFYDIKFDPEKPQLGIQSASDDD
jgi:hypothetical protein